jgi:hypothetical protein
VEAKLEELYKSLVGVEAKLEELYNNEGLDIFSRI